MKMIQNQYNIQCICPLAINLIFINNRILHCQDGSLLAWNSPSSSSSVAKQNIATIAGILWCGLQKNSRILCGNNSVRSPSTEIPSAVGSPPMADRGDSSAVATNTSTTRPSLAANYSSNSSSSGDFAQTDIQPPVYPFPQQQGMSTQSLLYSLPPVLYQQIMHLPQTQQQQYILQYHLQLQRHGGELGIVDGTQANPWLGALQTPDGSNRAVTTTSTIDNSRQQQIQRGSQNAAGIDSSQTASVEGNMNWLMVEHENGQMMLFSRITSQLVVCVCLPSEYRQLEALKQRILVNKSGIV